LCDVIVLNVYDTTEDKIDDIQAKELENVFDKLPNYHMKIFFGDFNAKIGREDFSNQRLGMKVYTKLLIIMEL
jgi:hypothetical protein